MMRSGLRGWSMRQQMTKRIKKRHPSEEVGCGSWIRGRWVPCDFLSPIGTCSLGQEPGGYCANKARGEGARFG